MRGGGAEVAESAAQVCAYLNTHAVVPTETPALRSRLVLTRNGPVLRVSAGLVARQ